MLETTHVNTPQPEPTRFEVLIAGGGVAGLEAAFALREVAGAGAELVHDALDRVDVDRRVAYTAAVVELRYDALLLGLGAQLVERYQHALAAAGL
jgi:NADH dehydrogenase FAD-containing subunit